MSDLENFRRETRVWLEANCPPEMRKPMTSESDTYWGGRNAKFSSEPQRVWFERMRDKGWTVPHWPTEYGGGGLDPEEAKIVRQEMAAIGARPPLVSGLFRAECRIGPCLAADPRREGWRRLHHHRPEDLDVVCELCRLDFLP